MVVMQIEVLCGHPAKKLNFYTFSDQFYWNLKIASFVAILTNFGQTQDWMDFSIFIGNTLKQKLSNLETQIWYQNDHK